MKRFFVIMLVILGMVLFPFAGVQAGDGHVNNVYTDVVIFNQLNPLEGDVDLLNNDFGFVVGVELEGNRDKWDANVEGVYFPETELGAVRTNLLYTLVDRDFNVQLNAGLGYYVQSNILELGISDFLMIDLDKFGFNTGIGLGYSLTESWDLNTGLNYRWLELDGDNLDGFELNVGVSYSF